MRGSQYHKLGLYAAFGISEAWTHDDGVKIFLLGPEGKYTDSACSLALPRLTPQILNHYLARRSVLSEAALVEEFRDRVRAKGPKDRRPE